MSQPSRGTSPGTSPQQTPSMSRNTTMDYHRIDSGAVGDDAPTPIDGSQHGGTAPGSITPAHLRPGSHVDAAEGTYSHGVVASPTDSAVAGSSAAATDADGATAPSSVAAAAGVDAALTVRQSGGGSVGLVNLGCTCYLNSLLQLLYHTPLFRNAVYQVDTTAEDAADIPYALQYLFYQLQERSDAVSTKVLTDSFEWGPRELAVQHDIQELAAKLRDTLETRMKGSINMLFTGIGEKYIRCLDGSHTSKNRDSFFDVHVPVAGFRTLQESLQSLLQTDQLTGDNKYKLERPGRPAEYKDAETGYRFLRFPPVLFFHLKRFEMDLMSPTLETKKVNTPFEFPSELDLFQFENGLDLAGEDVDGCGDPTLKQAFETARLQDERFEGYKGLSRPMYDLYGVLVHAGGVQAGHYTCAIRSWDATTQSFGQWYNYDDHFVSPVPEDVAVTRNYGGYVAARNYLSTKNAYMLAYVRRTDAARVFSPANADNLLAAAVRAKFNERVQEEERVARLEAERNRMCHVSLVLDSDISDFVEQEQVGLFEAKTTGRRFSVPKTATTLEIYQQALHVLRETGGFILPRAPNLESPEDMKIHRLNQEAADAHLFLLHGMEALGHPSVSNSYDLQNRIDPTALGTVDTARLAADIAAGRRTADSGTDVDKLPFAPAVAKMQQSEDRPWKVLLYVELPQVQPAMLPTNVAWRAAFRVSSNFAERGTDAPTAEMVCDTKQFSFTPDDHTATMSITLDAPYNVDSVSFRTVATRNVAATFFKILIQLRNAAGAELALTTLDYSNCAYVSRVCEALFDPPVPNVSSVVIQRTDLRVQRDQYRNPLVPDKFVISRVKVTVPITQLPRVPLPPAQFQSVPAHPKNIWVAVKFYNFRRPSLRYMGMLQLPGSDFLLTAFPAIRALCGISDLPTTGLRVFLERRESTGCLEIAMNRHANELTFGGTNNVTNMTTLIVQEDPDVHGAPSMYEFPYAAEYVQLEHNLCQVAFFRLQDRAITGVQVPEFATYDVLCEALANRINVAPDRLRLFEAREFWSEGQHQIAPKRDALRSDDSVAELFYRRGSVKLFYEVLERSLREIEADVQVSVHLADVHGLYVRPPGWSPTTVTAAGVAPNADSAAAAAANAAAATGEGATTPRAGSTSPRPGSTTPRSGAATSASPAAAGAAVKEEVPPPFEGTISARLSLPEFAARILEAYGLPFDRPHYFADVRNNIIYGIFYVAPKHWGATSDGSAATALPASTHANFKTVGDMFRQMEGRKIELRQVELPDAHELAVPLTGGHYIQHYDPVFVRNPTLMNIPIGCGIHTALEVAMRAYNVAKEDLAVEPANYELMLYTDVPLRFDNWNTPAQEYWTNNTCRGLRPTSFLLNLKRQKEKPGSRYVPSQAPDLVLDKRERERRKQQQLDRENAAGGGTKVPLSTSTSTTNWNGTTTAGPGVDAV